MATTLFSDLFRIEQLDTGNYDRIARIEAHSTSIPGTELKLDINTELYPVHAGETLTIALASSLGGESTGAAATRSWRPPKAGEKSLADEFEYVMYGTIYKFTEASGGDRLSVYASFGGLLLLLEGSHRQLSTLPQDHIYLLIRR